MVTCTRILAFDAAHRVKDHESVCKYIHGHRYQFEATFAAETLDPLGRVVDFGVIKTLLGGWIQEHWDHTLILHEDDQTLGEAIASYTHQTVYYLPYNPTAEHMADYLLTEICPQLFTTTGLRCIAIRLYETPHCYADAQ